DGDRDSQRFDGHGIRRRGRGRGVRHPDRHPQHAELLAPEASVTDAKTGLAETRDERHSGRVADGRGVCHVRRDLPRHPVRARRADVFRPQPQHPGPVGDPAGAEPVALAHLRRSEPRDGQAGVRPGHVARGPRGRGRRVTRRGAPGAGQGAFRRRPVARLQRAKGAAGAIEATRGAPGPKDGVNRPGGLSDKKGTGRSRRGGPGGETMRPTPRFAIRMGAAALAVAAFVIAWFAFFRQEIDPSVVRASPTTKSEPQVLFDKWPQDRKPDLVLVVTGQMYGYLQKCGCSSPQKGGLERRYKFIESLKAPGWEGVGPDVRPRPPPLPL